MSDQTYLIILRLLHIGFGIFWAGSAIYFALFIIPAIKASGPEGTKFMQELGKTGFPIVIIVSAFITIVAGFLLIWELSGGFQPAWFSTWYSRTITIGAAFAFIAFIIGVTVNRPAAAKISKIGQAITRQGGPPTAEQMEQLMALRKRIFTGSNYIAALLVVAVIAMSVFRYISAIIT